MKQSYPVSPAMEAATTSAAPPFALSYKGIFNFTVQLEVAASPKIVYPLWHLACCLEAAFREHAQLLQLNCSDDTRSSADGTESKVSGQESTGAFPQVMEEERILRKADQLALASAFMEYIFHPSSPPDLSHHTTEASSTHLKYILVRCVRASVDTQLLSGKENLFQLAARCIDPESVVRQYVHSSVNLNKKEVRDICFDAQQVQPLPTFGPKPSALLQAAKIGDVGLVATFGGQGANLVYFQELRYLFDVYRPVLDDFMSAISQHLELLAAKCRLDGLSPASQQHGWELYRWLTKPSTSPPEQALASVTTAAVLIAVLQLSQCVVLAAIMELDSPGDLSSLFLSSVGHSQGLICSVALATSTDRTSFVQNAKKGTTLLFWMSLRAYEISCSMPGGQISGHSTTTLTSPMVFVSGLSRAELQKHVDQANWHLFHKPGGRRANELDVRISLTNGPTAFVITGQPDFLGILCRTLESLAADESKTGREGGSEDSRFRARTERKKISIRTLPVDVPFHHPALVDCAEKVLEWDICLDAQEELDFWKPEELRIPVYDTVDGSNLQDHDPALHGSSLVRRVVTDVLLRHVDWPACVSASVAGAKAQLPETTAGLFYLDLGPGREAGACSMINRLLQGTGAKALAVGSTIATQSALSELWHPSKVVAAPNWLIQFAPRVVQQPHAANGKIITTRFSQLLGTPPVMVAGMTPTTGDVRLVSAILNAGYHVELGSGHILTRTELRDKVLRICKMTPAEHGLTLNALYLAPRYFRMLIDEWLQLRSEGYPIRGLTVAGGVPSVEEAVALIRRIQSAKLQHIAFKPSNTKALLQIVEISKLVPEFPIILQWTGGRAGGHHSNEDQFEPLLSAYAALRSMSNVYIVIGGGLAHPNDGIEWLGGSWSTRFGRAHMPVDGILLGTAITVVAEAATSEPVKRRIVQAPGCPDNKWQESYTRSAGGVVSVVSEYGEPIHVLENRCGRLWKLLDEQLFSLATLEQRSRYLRQNRTTIIARLNADYQRPWFCVDQEGRAVEDLGQMTYYLLARRFIDLTRHPSTCQWISTSWYQIAQQILLRIQERFLDHEALQKKTSLLQLEQQDGSQAEQVLERLVEAIPESGTTLLLEEDCLWILQIWSGRGIKPVPFIPALDERFETYFKKDSIWQWENIDVVPFQDPERVLCLVGPVALQHCKQANIGSKDFLDSHLKALVEAFASKGSPSQPPAYVPASQDGTIPNPISIPGFLDVTRTLDEHSYLRVLCSAVSSPQIFHEDGKLGENYLQALLQQLGSEGFVVVHANLRCIEVFAGKAQLAQHRMILSLSLLDKGQIRATLWINDEPLQGLQRQDELVHQDSPSPRLELVYSCVPSHPFACLREVGRSERIERTRTLYYQLWCASAQIEHEQAEEGFKFIAKTALTQEMASTAATLLGKAGTTSNGEHASIGIAFILGWRAIAAALLSECKENDLLRLVHLGNRTELAAAPDWLSVGDTANTTATVMGVKLVPAGKQVQIRCNISNQDGNAIFVVHSDFLFRGVANLDRQLLVKEFDYVYVLASEEARAVILARNWIHWREDVLHTAAVAVGARLRIRVQTRMMLDHEGLPCTYEASGSVHTYATQPTSEPSTPHLASIRLVSYGKDASTDPIAALFSLHGRPSRIEAPLADPRLLASRLKIAMPTSSHSYSNFSLDTNPLHTNVAFALAAGLEKPMVHGMQTHAYVVDALASIAAGGRSEMLESVSCEFTAMIHHGESIWLDITHTAMLQGKLVVKVQGFNAEGTLVLQGESIVRTRTMALVFTGQGSQYQGMGKNHMSTSTVAQKVWEQAERHCLDKMGFSLLDIVHNNPTTKTIHFGGAKGAALRKRYMRMGCTLDVSGDDEGDSDTQAPGNPRTRFFPQIDLQSSEYQFHHKNGLLFQTQFAQVAIAVLEYSLWLELEQAQISKPDAWAGHSAGEFAALTSLAGFSCLEHLIDIMWFRGLLMISTIPSTEVQPNNSETSFAMCAVNPSKVGIRNQAFSEMELQYVTSTVESMTGMLCQVVNYNIEGEQYVLSGQIACLQLLGLVLEEIQVHENISEDILGATVDSIWNQQKHSLLRCSELSRTKALTPLPGINMPFHSRMFRTAVAPLRRMLLDKWDVQSLDTQSLVSKWVPNVVGAPFEVSKKYLKVCLDEVSSPTLQKLWQNWDSLLDMPGGQQVAAYIMLVELMAFQICSPVRWTRCQEHVLQRCHTIVELGPSPVLTRMMPSTIRRRFQDADRYLGVQRELCSVSKFQEDFYRAISGRSAVAAGDNDDSNAQPKLVQTNSAVPIQATSTSPKMLPRSSSPPTGTSSPVQPQPQASTLHQPAEQADEGLKPILHLRILIAVKLKKSLDQVSADSTIKALTGGRSVLTNELISDLEEEFNGLPERSEVLSLAETASAMGTSDQEQLGKVSSKWLRTMAQSYLPVSLNTPRAIKEAFVSLGLGPRRAAAAALFSLLAPPTSRLSGPNAQTWLETTLESYASTVGYVARPPGAGDGHPENAGTPGQGVTTISSSEWSQHVQREARLVNKVVDALQERFPDSSSHRTDFEASQQAEVNKQLSASQQAVLTEHGPEYVEGIRSQFDAAKVRSFESGWAWTRQLLFRSFHDPTLLGIDSDPYVRRAQLRLLQRKYTGQEFALTLKALLQIFDLKLHPEARDALKDLLKLETGLEPKYWPSLDGTRPVTCISHEGRIEYSEEKRKHHDDKGDKLDVYIREMFRPSEGTRSVRKKTRASSGTGAGRVQLRRAAMPTSGFLQPKVTVNSRSLIVVKSTLSSGPSKMLTEALESCMWQIKEKGMSLTGRNILVTGAGRNSIGEQLVASLLAAGSRLVVTSSTLSAQTASRWKKMYQTHATGKASLLVVPFNMASRSDVDELVAWIYSAQGLGIDLDYVLPFAAISEEGRKMDNIDDVSELAHRAMLTNTVRLIGQICHHKQSTGQSMRPCRVILPFSPNHGMFGGDGLYSESKRGLEVLLKKPWAEGWDRWIQVIGAEIGWTRGTGLMDQMNVLAEDFESMHPLARTFSPAEMGFNLLTLMHDSLEHHTRRTSIVADFSGGLKQVSAISRRLGALRVALRSQASIAKALAAVTRAEESNRWKAQNSADSSPAKSTEMQTKAPGGIAYPTRARATHRAKFPAIPEAPEALKAGLLDLDRTPVIVGFAEVGPYGSSRTRWEAELNSQHWSIEANVELAFLMGLIKFHSGFLANGQRYTGWIVVETNEAIADAEVEGVFGELMRDRCGIRSFKDDDTLTPSLFQRITLQHDLEAVEMSNEEADFVKSKYGNSVRIVEKAGAKFVTLLRGAEILVSKGSARRRFVGGLIPTGWDPTRLGIPKDRAESMDIAAVWALVATADAFSSAGIEDPYELFQHVHISEVGNAIGSAMGGLRSCERMYQLRSTSESAVQADILQETFVNSIGAWVQLLLLSSSGPVLTPTAACATGAVSLCMGKTAIQTGEAKVMICGAFDDLTATSSTEFGNMNATLDNDRDVAAGRHPKEASRPFSAGRGGFTEAQGGGVQILTTAKLALELGLPIYGVLAAANTATDRQGFSIPAPGKGLLSHVGEEQRSQLYWDQILSLQRRCEVANARAEELQQLVDHHLTEAHAKFSKSLDHVALKADCTLLTEVIERREAEFAAPAPGSTGASILRQALATYGLNADHIGFISCHGTGTQAGDLNECDLHDRTLTQLGRTPGFCCPLVAQKSLVGHAKGGAASWAVNGALQALLTRTVPRTDTLDDVDARLRCRTQLLFLSEPMPLAPQAQACLVTSMGFGQAGAQVLLVSGQNLLESISMAELDLYRRRNERRKESASRLLCRMLKQDNAWVRLKQEPPYKLENFERILLDRQARAHTEMDDTTGIVNYQILPGSGDQVQLQGRVVSAHVKGVPLPSDERMALQVATKLLHHAPNGAEQWKMEMLASNEKVPQSQAHPIAHFYHPQHHGYIRVYRTLLRSDSVLVSAVFLSRRASTGP